MKTIRHGDIILQECEMPKEAKTIFEGTEFVVAEGETTGHKHTLVADRPFTVKELGETRYFTFTSPAKIKHEEHKTIEVSPLTYREINEREKDWFSLSVRKVVD